jgi:hypothetical protein
MFFLGGINSVLPFVVYLSVVWLFLLVGFVGKINEIWLKINPADNNSHETARLADRKVGACFHYTPNHQVRKTEFCCSVLYYYELSNKIFTFNILYDSGIPASLFHQVNCLRGPPAAFC